MLEGARIPIVDVGGSSTRVSRRKRVSKYITRGGFIKGRPGKRFSGTEVGTEMGMKAQGRWIGKEESETRKGHKGPEMMRTKRA